MVNNNKKKKEKVLIDYRKKDPVENGESNALSTGGRRERVVPFIWVPPLLSFSFFLFLLFRLVRLSVPYSILLLFCFHINFRSCDPPVNTGLLVDVFILSFESSSLSFFFLSIYLSTYLSFYCIVIICTRTQQTRTHTHDESL